MRQERSIAEGNPIMADFFIRRYLKGRSLEERDAERDPKIKAEAVVKAKNETDRQHIQRMHKKGFAPELIADLLEVELAFVENTIQAMAVPDPEKTKPAKKARKQKAKKPSSKKA